MHYVTGALLVVWSAASVFLLRRESIASIGALGTAVILLLSAAYTLANAVRASRRIAVSAKQVLVSQPLGRLGDRPQRNLTSASIVSFGFSSITQCPVFFRTTKVTSDATSFI